MAGHHIPHFQNDAGHRKIEIGDHAAQDRHLLGILLALPIPFTNAVFASVLLVYALALLERDGALMLVAWALGLATVATVGVLSGSLASLVTPWIDRLI